MQEARLPTFHFQYLLRKRVASSRNLCNILVRREGHDCKGGQEGGCCERPNPAIQSAIRGWRSIFRTEDEERERESTSDLAGGCWIPLQPPLSFPPQA